MTTMEIDWQRRIVEMALIKQDIRRLDSRGLWPHHLPEVAADEGRIASCERGIARRLDPQYRAFLGCADGWKGFYQTVDLFGTSELKNPEDHTKGGELLDALAASGVLDRSRVQRQDLLVLGLARKDIDLFVLSRSPAGAPDAVLWFGGEEVERYSDFEHFFAAFVEFDRMELEQLLNEAKSRGLH